MWTTIEEICSKIGSGSTPRGSNYSANGIPFFRSQNVYNDRLVYDDIKYISEEVHQKMKGTEVLANDLLLNITGGSLGRCAVVPADFNCGNVSQHVCIMRSVLVEPEYFHALVLSSYFAKSMKITGSGREGLPKYNLEQMGFPLPPLTEQQRIVAEIEHWFALIDQIEQGKADLQTIIKQTKSKILGLAIHGKLVPQDPNDEPAIELLKRINPDFTPCDNGHSEKLPQGWSITELTNLADIKNGYAFKSSNYISSNGVRLIRIANVQDGYIEDKMPQFYPFDKMKALKDFMLTEGDILMSLTGNVGRVGILTNELLPAALNQRVACIKEHPNIIAKKFLFYTFQTSNFSKDCVKSGKGVAQLNISTEWLKHYFILIPPLTEQQRIVQKIEELFSVLDNIQNALEV